MSRRRPNGPHLARELEVRYTTHRARVLYDGKQITTAADAAAILVPLLESQPQEIFVAIHMDAKRRLLGVQEVGRGGLTETVVSIRSILTACLGEHNTAAILLGHNHPSGDPEPSAVDLSLTRKIIEACRLFDIEVCDHIVVGQGRYISFKRTERMQRL